MKAFKKIGNGIFKSEDGYTIKKHAPMNIFTGKQMSARETRWYIFNSNGEKIDWAFTLKEAKMIVERM